MDNPPIDGFGHIDLTVTDGERSVQWWDDVMGFKLIGTFEKPAFRGWTMVHSSGLVVSVMTHADARQHQFDERRVGLDHLALRVRDRTTLEQWAKHLDALGIPHSGVQEETGGPLIVLRDPDNIQLELWVFDVERLVRRPASKPSPP